MSRARHLALAIRVSLLVAIAGRGTADASELVLNRAALQALVASTLFHDAGRWYLQKGACFAYLEHPTVTLTKDRMLIDARLAGRLGLESQGTCIGVNLASPVAISGILRGSGSQLSVQDLRVERANDETTRRAFALLLGVSSESVSHALSIDLMTVVKPTAIPGLLMPARVTRLVISDVTTAEQSVSVQFDLGVAIP